MCCKNCGSQTSENERFCSCCGTEIKMDVCVDSKDFEKAEIHIDCEKESDINLLAWVLVSLMFVVNVAIHIVWGEEMLEMLSEIFYF